MDLGLSRDMFDSFVQYQTAMGKIFKRLQTTYGFTIVEGDWLPGSHELTPTMKLKRRPIADKYAAQIDAMYS